MSSEPPRTLPPLPSLSPPSLPSPTPTPPAPEPSVLDLAPVVPVVVVADAADAVPLARALVAGGLPAIEVTLRTPAALDAIRAVAAEVPGAVVGAGTVRSPGDVAAAVGAGARFLVSPGWTDGLLEAMRGAGVPFLPGVSTASEVLALLERGVRELKFFPAEAAGGAAYLKALAGPLPEARFCPTGGITAASAPGYLALANVGCVGGTWMLPADAPAARDWARVEALAREAAALGRDAP
ncbi:bifunctional 4-hydroxy-2-oxoglutarate aldolase/2-dehydro-3-deoxy-phosphogluconate aldolase [Streptomyces sp. LP05-1]|uniref:2-dehydro-3-deoxy-phosphogluconate aldolase n=1 Tax=Streptomyces pyxinae TaxID=2970734 RepID=A0ABT2CQ44_9ACTN|nr:bifunctional 4-hydroxy-2-oxoglutarate aldolase/2-dehydro-3-deoxy-phosphogluconate aldolase [Streptomyces sp. LP05-1]MCS0639212.1 bifunctional 4-hydroxy-2-oxoglutarate aldolase/2-dehydro-3-deoxy-phosphogluconate aldolase [Streptomyces sp. LP05-1]